MDEAHLLAAVSYVALNPVRARLVERATDWTWSSVHALLNPVEGDGLTETAPVLDRVENFAALLRAGEGTELSAALRMAESIGRPLGDAAFLSNVAKQTGRDPTPRRPGRPTAKGR
jgi:putative transposase